MKNIVTPVIGGLLAVLPLLVPGLPHETQAIAVAGISLLGSIYHLFQDNPNGGNKK